jgi:hypothetical protein
MRSNARIVRAVRKIVSGAMNGLVDSVGGGWWLAVQGRVSRFLEYSGDDRV